MVVIKDRKTPNENLAFIGIMSAINAVFSLISYYLPIGGLILLLVIPLTSLLVILTCKGKYLPIYIVTSLFISLVVTSFDIISNILFLLPPLSIGIFYGIFYKKKVPTSLNILLTSLINISFLLISVLLFKILVKVNIISTFLSLIKVNQSRNGELISPALIFLYSICQVIVIHFAIQIFGNSLKISTIKNEKITNKYPLIIVVLSLGSIGLSYVSLPISYIVLISSFYLSFFSLVNLIKSKDKYKIVFLSILLIMSFIMIPLTYQYVDEYRKIFLYFGIPCSIGIAGLFKSSYNFITYPTTED